MKPRGATACACADGQHELSMVVGQKRERGREGGRVIYNMLESGLLVNSISVKKGTRVSNHSCVC